MNYKAFDNRIIDLIPSADLRRKRKALPLSAITHTGGASLAEVCKDRPVRLARHGREHRRARYKDFERQSIT